MDLAYVACGRLDGYFEIGLGSWDVAAGAIIVLEACGKVTNWQGKDWRLRKTNNIVATNAFIHDEILNYISDKGII
ncbi:fructose-1 [Peptococcaceae bacterium DYL19]|nr:fructose-1 [Phosphitispora fastidiosa]